MPAYLAAYRLHWTVWQDAYHDNGECYEPCYVIHHTSDHARYLRNRIMDILYPIDSYIICEDN